MSSLKHNMCVPGACAYLLQLLPSHKGASKPAPATLPQPPSSTQPLPPSTSYTQPLSNSPPPQASTSAEALEHLAATPCTPSTPQQDQAQPQQQQQQQQQQEQQQEPPRKQGLHINLSDVHRAGAVCSDSMQHSDGQLQSVPEGEGVHKSGFAGHMQLCTQDNLMADGL